jgi:hypothetical protein
MTLKGLIQPGHIPVNKYQLIFPGVPPLTVTKLGGLEEELETVEQPDRTVHSNGQTKPTELTIELMMHHTVEQAAMELWYAISKDPVLPGYKKDGTLIHLSVSTVGLPVVYAVIGCFPKMRKTPEMDMSNESDAAIVEWTLSVDDVAPI